MSVSASRSDLNIQEKLKTGIKTPEAQIAQLTALLRSPRLPGKALRVLAGLVRRMPPPRTPYTGQELEVLLLLSTALKRAGMWRP